MPLYRYEVTDRNGKTMMGAMDAASETHVRDRLTASGYTIKTVLASGVVNRTIQQRSVQQSAAPTPYAGVRTSRASAPSKELAVFFRSLAQFLQSGIGLQQAIANVGSRTPNRAMYNICQRLSAKVGEGGTLNAGMAEFPRAFPPHIVGTVAAGEVAGLLPVILADIALDYELAQRASSRVIKGFSWLLWINTLGVLLIAPLIPLLVKGAFAAMDQPGGSTPGLQFGLSALRPFWAFTIHYSLPVLVGAPVIYHILGWILKQPSMRPLAHNMVLRVPWAGRASRERSLASFSRILWRLQNAGILPIQAWTVASQVPENQVIAEGLRAQTEAVRAGAKFSDACKSAGVFTDDDLRVLSSAETSGQTADSLQRIAAYYEDAAQVSGNRAKWLGLRIAIFVTIVSGGIAMICAFSANGVAMNAIDKWAQ